MNKNIVILIFAIVVILAGFVIVDNLGPRTNSEQTNSPANDSIKEFKMDSFYEVVDGKPKPQYSIKEITVKKGDLVRIQVTVTKGDHDFNIDEYNIHTETPLNQPTIVEFKADKVGEFVYYCSRPGHRENGHWGTLKVIE